MRTDRSDGGLVTLGGRVRQLRIARNLTQQQLAHPLFTHAYVSMVETDKQLPSRKALEHFAQRLGVSAQELESGIPEELKPTLEATLIEARRAGSAGRVQEATRLYEDVETDASRYNLAGLIAKARLGRGALLEGSGRLPDALRLYEEAEALLDEEPLNVRVDAVAGQARCYQLIGEQRHAIYLLEGYQDQLERSGLDDPETLVRLHASLVAVYFDAALYLKANESAEIALGLAESSSDPERAANMYVNVAWVLMRDGRHERALESLTRAETLYRRLELKSELARAHLVRGVCLAKDGHPESGRGELRLAAGIFAECQSPINEARALNELAHLERAAGRLSEATAALRRALQIPEVAEVGGVRGGTCREMALVMKERGEEGAEEYLRQSIELFEKANEPAELARSHRELGDLLSARGDLEAAARSFREGVLLLEAGD